MTFKKIANTEATGTVQWFKVLGDPVPNYNEDGFEWTFHFKPDNLDLFTNYGLTEKFRNDYIKFTRRQMSKTGEANKNIPVTDAKGDDWDQTVLVGNDSRVRIEFSVYQTSYKTKTFTNVAPLSVTILDHKPFVKKTREKRVENVAIAEENWSTE